MGEGRNRWDGKREREKKMDEMGKGRAGKVGEGRDREEKLSDCLARE